MNQPVRTPLRKIIQKRCSEFIPNDGWDDDDNSESENLPLIEHQDVPVNVELRRSNRVRKTNPRYLSDEFEHSEIGNYNFTQRKLFDYKKGGIIYPTLDQSIVFMFCSFRQV